MPGRLKATAAVDFAVVDGVVVEDVAAGRAVDGLTPLSDTAPPPFA